jgi:hypothetical protein
MVGVVVASGMQVLYTSGCVDVCRADGNRSQSAECQVGQAQVYACHTFVCGAVCFLMFLVGARCLHIAEGSPGLATPLLVVWQLRCLAYVHSGESS